MGSQQRRYAYLGQRRSCIVLLKSHLTIATLLATEFDLQLSDGVYFGKFLQVAGTVFTIRANGQPVPHPLTIDNTDETISTSNDSDRYENETPKRAGIWPSENASNIGAYNPKSHKQEGPAQTL